MGCTPGKVKREVKIENSSTEHTRAPRRVSTKEELKISAQQFIKKKSGPIRDSYIIGPKLGSGAYGFVRLATFRTTGQQRAIKSVNKLKISNDMRERTRFYHEIDVLSQLDHPNIVRLYEFYEDEKYFHLVTEFIKGGELFDFIIKSKMLSEPVAARFMRQLLGVVTYCHARGIVHRDLKPENLLLESESVDAHIKVIDFGTSALYSSTDHMTQKYGTSYYIAPEVLKRNYNEKCDVWSCGVILFILLCGKPPFYGKEDRDIIKRVEKGEYSFRGSEWQSVSESAKNLIRKMLTYNPAFRISAKEALEDEWISTHCNMPLSKNPPEALVLNNLKSFAAQIKLQQAIMTFIASQLLTKEETQQLTENFKLLDRNGDGKLSREELLQAYSATMSLQAAEDEVERIMAMVDIDGSGFIDYTEFIVATTQKETLLSKENLEKAFSVFDRDGSGQISAGELRAMLGDQAVCEQSIWSDLIREVDLNGDGEIDIQEFKQIMLRLASAN